LVAEQNSAALEQGSAQPSRNVSCYSETQLQLVHYTIPLKGIVSSTLTVIRAHTLFPS